MISSPWPKPCGGMWPCHQVRTVWPSYAAPAGSSRRARGQRVEPHEVAVAFEDHRPARARARCTAPRTGRPASCPGLRRHQHHRRLQFRRRLEVLPLVRIRRVGARGGGSGGARELRVLVGDYEVVGERLGLRSPRSACRAPSPSRRARTAWRARSSRRRPASMRQMPRMRAGLEPLTWIALSALAGSPRHADLRRWGGAVGVRQRRHRQARARQHGRAFERGGGAASRARRACTRTARAEIRRARQRQRRGAGEHHHDHGAAE